MMSILMWPLAVWGVVTAVLVILLIYRSTLTMQEDDQLFLGESESHMEKEQIEIMAKVNKITPLVKWVGAAPGDRWAGCVSGIAERSAVVRGDRLAPAGGFAARTACHRCLAGKLSKGEARMRLTLYFLNSCGC